MYQTSKVRMKKILGRHSLEKALDDCIDDDFPSIGLGALTKVRPTYTLWLVKVFALKRDPLFCLKQDDKYVLRDEVPI